MPKATQASNRQSQYLNLGDLIPKPSPLGPRKEPTERYRDASFLSCALQFAEQGESQLSILNPLRYEFNVGPRGRKRWEQSLKV